MRKDKPDTEKKVIEFNSRLLKFCSKNKIDIIKNENLDGSCLSFKNLHLKKKGNSYLANTFLDFLHSFWFGKFLPASPKTRHFRPKLVNWNECVYCTPIDRALKMWFSEGSGSFLWPTIPELWRFLWNQLRRFLDHINTNIRRFSKIFRHKTRIISLQKV